MHTATETPNELIRLSDALLSRFGLDIEDGGRLVRCAVLSEFMVVTFSEEPDLTMYRITQLDNDREIRHLFAAARLKGGSIDVQLCRNGDWEKTFRTFVTDVIN
jgi:hypothetical protein